MKFNKVLARHYKKWHIDCLRSANYCDNHGDPATAEYYRGRAAEYEILIEDNKEAVEFFSENGGANAHKRVQDLPKKFQGYN